MLHDCPPQESVTLFGTVPAEGGFLSHLGARLLHCLNNRRSKRTGYISYSQPDDGLVGIGFRKRGNPSGNVRKQIALRQFDEILVNSEHISFLHIYFSAKRYFIFLSLIRH